MKSFGKKCACFLMIIATAVLLNAAGFNVIKSRVYPHIITPNNDNRNDTFFVFCNNPMDSAVEGKIFDMNGGEVADMLVQPVADDFALTELSWDGKDAAGSTVPAGVYVYQVEAEGNIFNGTVVVAR